MVALPYGLGSLHNKQIAIVDAQLSSVFLRKIESEPAAAAFAQLVAASSLDTTTAPTTSSCSDQLKPALSGAACDTAARSEVYWAQLMPARRRLFVLPPGALLLLRMWLNTVWLLGQAGATVYDLVSLEHTLQTLRA